jgi:hypothetical protein
MARNRSEKTPDLSQWHRVAITCDDQYNAIGHYQFNILTSRGLEIWDYTPSGKTLRKIIKNAII